MDDVKVRVCRRGHEVSGHNAIINGRYTSCRKCLNQTQEARRQLIKERGYE